MSCVRDAKQRNDLDLEKIVKQQASKIHWESVRAWEKQNLVEKWHQLPFFKQLFTLEPTPPPYYESTIKIRNEINKCGSRQYEEAYLLERLTTFELVLKNSTTEPEVTPEEVKRLALCNK